MKVNFKVVGAIVLALLAFFFLAFIVSDVDEPIEDVTWDKLEEVTGMEWDMYSVEFFGSDPCDAFRYFQPDTGCEIYVFIYSDTYAEVSIDFGHLGIFEDDVHMQDEILSLLSDLYGEQSISPVIPINVNLDMDLGGF